jgi:tetratricopeptide (TPR) repeat protein
MYNILISIAAGVVVTLAIKLLGFSFLAAILPGVLALLASFILLARRVALKVQNIVGIAQKELSIPPANAREQKQRVEKAIKILEEGLAYDRWQILVGSEIHSQIGMIKYMVKDLDGAQVHFAKANARNYMAMAMQAALYYQRKDYSKMEATFETAVKSGKKEGLVWAAYAWCLLQQKEKEKALKVMVRAVENNPTDEKLKAGLTALQNDKKLKMKPYEPMWWQFGLEQPPSPMPGGRNVQFVRR